MWINKVKFIIYSQGLTNMWKVQPESRKCWDVFLNLMPATGLKIVGMGACLPWCSISSSFQNSLKTSGHRVYEFRCWNLVPVFPDIGFQLLKSLWLSLTCLPFIDAPNVLYRWKIWTAGRPIQHLDSFTMKPCCCNSCSMWFCIVLLKYTRLPWNRHRLDGSICWAKTFIYLSEFIVPSKLCKLTIPYVLMHPHTIRDACF